MVPTPDTSTLRWRFGPWVLDPARRELLRGGIPQALPARAFECLHYLIEHRDRAVGRDELVRAVFGRRDVSDAQLAQIVLRARRAIGDDGQEQRAIRTVPRFGFRWTAEIETIEVAVVPPGAIATIASTTTTTPTTQVETTTQVHPIAHPPRGIANVSITVLCFAFAAVLMLFAWFIASRPTQAACVVEPEVVDPMEEQHP